MKIGAHFFLPLMTPGYDTQATRWAKYRGIPGFA